MIIVWALGVLAFVLMLGQGRRAIGAYRRKKAGWGQRVYDRSEQPRAYFCALGLEIVFTVVMVFYVSLFAKAFVEMVQS